jgi:hypothetical protein
VSRVSALLMIRRGPALRDSGLPATRTITKAKNRLYIVFVYVSKKLPENQKFHAHKQTAKVENAVNCIIVITS